MSDEELGALDNDDYDYQPVQPRNRGAAKQQEVKPQKKDSFEEIDDDFLDDDPRPAQKTQPPKKEEPKQNQWQAPAQKQQSKQYDEENEFEEMNDYNDQSPKDSFGKVQNQPQKQVVKQEEPEEKEDSYYEEYKYESEEDDTNQKQQVNRQASKSQQKQNAYHYDDDEDDQNQEDQSPEESRRNDNDDQDFEAADDDDYGEDFDEDDEEAKLSKIDERHNGENEQGDSSDYQQYDNQDNQQNDETQNNDQSMISYEQSQARKSMRQNKENRRPPKGKVQEKKSYVEKYQHIIAHTDYSTFSDQQLLKENSALRAKLKEISEDVSKLVDKAAAKPVVQQKKQVSLENKNKILRTEIDTNEKKLKTQQKEIQKLKQRIEKVGSPKYLTDLNEELKQITKTIEEKRKKIKQDQLEQNKKGKNLDQIENVDGIPESLQEKQKKSIELELLKRKNEVLQQQISKVRAEITENEAKQPRISQALQEKIEQAVKLKLDVETDKQQMQLREKFNNLERKKNMLEKHLESMKSKDSKVQIAENQIKELKKLIAMKNNDINLIEMQIIEQRKYFEDNKSRQTDGQLKHYLPAAAQTQQNYNVQTDQRVTNQENKQTRKLVSAKPSVQHQDNINLNLKLKNDDIEQKQVQSDKTQTKIQANQPKETIEEQALEESVQNDNLQFKMQPHPQPQHETSQMTQNQTQIQQNQPVNKNKPFTFKKSQPEVESEPKIDTTTQQKQNESNILTFGKQEDKGLEFQIKPETRSKDDENQLTFGNKGTSEFLIKPESKPIIKQEDPPAIQTENNFPTRRMFRMGQRTEQNSSNISYDASDQQKSVIEPPKQQESTYDPFSRQQVATKAPEPTNPNTGYQISTGEQPVPQRRLRQAGTSNNTMLNSNDISTQGDNPQNESVISSQKPQQIDQVPAYEIPAAGGRRRNDGRTNQFSLQENQQGYNLNPQQQTTEKILDKKNDSSFTAQLNVAQDNTNKPMFNFSRKQTEATVVEQPQVTQKPVEQQSQPQPKPAAGRRQNGPRKLDLWADEPQETNTDVYNIKTINEVNPPQQQKIEPTYQSRNQPQEEERELTLDEILGGGAGEKKETNSYQPYSLNTNTVASNNLSNQRRKPQQVSQTEKEKQLAQQAEKQDFFGDFEV